MESDQMDSRMSMRSLFDMLLQSYTCYASPRWMDFDSDVSAVEDFNKLLKNLMSMRSIEYVDCGVSLKSDQSNQRMIDFKDRVSPRPDFSSSEEDDVSDDGFFQSPDDLMATGSVQSVDSGVSFKSDGSKAEPVHFKEGVSPSEEMNQELSSEVG